MKILVTGSAGFIGTHLVENLKDYEVIVYDKKTNFHNNLIDYSNILQFLRTNKPDIVIHLAAHTGEDIIENYRDNIQATINLIGAIKSTGIKKLIFTSSAAVYGDRIDAIERDIPNPSGIYGASKRLLELFIKNSGLNYVILRPSNIYGKGGRGVISKWITSIKKDNEISRNGNGLQLRDYIHVSDIIRAILTFIKQDTLDNEIYNVSSGKKTRLCEIIKTLESSFKGFAINCNPPRDEIMYSCLNNSKIKKLGWEPQVSLKEGIRRMIEDEK